MRDMATEANDPLGNSRGDAAVEAGAAYGRPDTESDFEPDSEPDSESDFEPDAGETEARSVPMSLIDRIGQERAHELMAEAVRQAVARQHAAGLPTAHGDGKGVYLLYPDGRKVYLDEEGKET